MIAFNINFIVGGNEHSMTAVICLRLARETLENPARLRENEPVIAGQDWINGWKIARFHGL